MCWILENCNRFATGGGFDSFGSGRCNGDIVATPRSAIRGWLVANVGRGRSHILDGRVILEELIEGSVIVKGICI